MKRCLSLLVLLSMLAGCGSQSVDAQKIEKTVYAMDTVMTMTAYPAEGQTEDDVSAALNAAQGEIQRLDALLSVSNEQGEIGGLNSGERTRLSDETGRLLQRALTIAADTGGAFDLHRGISCADGAGAGFGARVCGVFTDLADAAGRKLAGRFAGERRD